MMRSATSCGVPQGMLFSHARHVFHRRIAEVLPRVLCGMQVFRTHIVGRGIG